MISEESRNKLSNARFKIGYTLNYCCAVNSYILNYLLNLDQNESEKEVLDYTFKGAISLAVLHLYRNVLKNTSLNFVAKHNIIFAVLTAALYGCFAADYLPRVQGQKIRGAIGPESLFYIDLRNELYKLNRNRDRQISNQIVLSIAAQLAADLPNIITLPPLAQNVRNFIVKAETSPLYQPLNEQFYGDLSKYENIHDSMNTKMGIQPLYRYVNDIYLERKMIIGAVSWALTAIIAIKTYDIASKFMPKLLAFGVDVLMLITMDFVMNRQQYNGKPLHQTIVKKQDELFNAAHKKGWISF